MEADDYPAGLNGHHPGGNRLSAHSSRTRLATDSVASSPQSTSILTPPDASNAAAVAEMGAKKAAVGPGTLSTTRLAEMEQMLSHPTSTEAHPRVGMRDRQRQVMSVAAKADPFMRTLAGGGDLDGTHELTRRHTGRRGKVKNHADLNGTGDVLKRSGQEVYAYGANEYQNRDGKLPNLTNHPVGADTNGGHSRTGRWSEADVNPRGVEDRDSSRKLTGRGKERLLHTGAASTAVGASGDTAIDHRFFVTPDHYHSMVPVTPLEQGYAARHPSTPKYNRDGSER